MTDIRHTLEPRTKGGLLALDLATKTGFSYAYPGELPNGGTWLLPKLSHEAGAQGAALMNLLYQVVDTYRPAFIYAGQAIIIPPRGDKDRMQQSVASMKAGFGLWGVAATVAYQESIAFREMLDTTARGIVLNDRHPTSTPKKVAMRFCHDRGWKFFDDNQADAEIVREAAMMNVFSKGAACPKGAWNKVRWWREGEML